MQLLVELDGLHSLPGLVVVGATNRPAVLDPPFFVQADSKSGTS
jgi:ATP-dependent Zn protease